MHKKEVVGENIPQLSAKKKRKEKGEDGRRKKKRIDEGDTIHNENWVQCEKCMKWRLIPSVENLPGTTLLLFCSSAIKKMLLTIYPP